MDETQTQSGSPQGKPVGGERKPKRARRWDIIIVVGIVVIALIGFIGVKVYGATNTANTVKISSPDGDVYLPLDEDTRYVLTTSLGSNTVVVSNRTVHIEDADCKNHLCEQQGTIDTPGQTLVCLPHKMYVEIVDQSGSGNDTGLDTVSS